LSSIIKAQAGVLELSGILSPKKWFTSTEALLRDSFPWEFQRQTRFVIVNPQKEVFERFKKTFNSSEVEWKSSKNIWIQSNGVVCEFYLCEHREHARIEG
jgi:hypothetical protein